MGVELKTTDLIADSFYPEGSECDALQQYWDSGAMPEGLGPLELLRDIEVEAEPEAGTDICFSMEAPSWYVGFSEGFLKATLIKSAIMRHYAHHVWRGDGREAGNAGGSLG